MKSEVVFAGLLPAAVGIAEICISLTLAIVTRRAFQLLAAVLTVLCCSWSLWVLYRIFIVNAWPTYLPHIVIGINAIILTGQFLDHRMTKWSASKRDSVSGRVLRAFLWIIVGPASSVVIGYIALLMLAFVFGNGINLDNRGTAMQRFFGSMALPVFWIISVGGGASALVAALAVLLRKS